MRRACTYQLKGCSGDHGQVWGCSRINMEWEWVPGAAPQEHCRQERNSRAERSALPSLVSPMHGAKIGCSDISPTCSSQLAGFSRTQPLWQGTRPNPEAELHHVNCY